MEQMHMTINFQDHMTLGRCMELILYGNLTLMPLLIVHAGTLYFSNFHVFQLSAHH